ncbi:MAG: thiamine pyrophosphate-dependent enzyme [Anaerolineae bacterium]
MKREVLLGNGAVARGIVESGCRLFSAYPGTPSSEILSEVARFKAAEGADLWVEWATNEKAALEMALAASYTGVRAAAAMKQVGLNVASDPLISTAYTGVAGGLVVVVADDPGPHSSQTEQDTRLFALVAKLPVLDPSTPREAKAMVEEAFRLSEAHRLPVIVRMTTRVCHASQSIPLSEIPAFNRQARFHKDPQRWAATPRFRYVLHQELNEKLTAVRESFERSPLNFVIGAPHPTPPRKRGEKRGRLGIIAGGVCYTAVRELLAETGLDEQISLLKIGTPHPLPLRLAGDFVDKHEWTLVLEEPDAAIELQLPDPSTCSGHRQGRVMGRLDDTVPSAGELTPEIVYRVLTNVLGQLEIADLPPLTDPRLDELVDGLDLPIRKPRLCPGCPHRSSFFALRQVFGPRAIYPSDIGCYTLGLNQRAVDTCLDMGAAVNMSSGFYHALQQTGEPPTIAATIGDSTFIHAGLPALVNAVYTRARFVLVILDNETTAMTGFQPTAATGYLSDGSQGERVPLPELVRGCGVRFVRVVDPYDQEATRAALEAARDFAATEEGGVAVVIAKRTCALRDPEPVRVGRPTIADECDGCRYCLINFECPAMLCDEANERVVIDERLCVECGQCVYACHKGFITV